MRHLAGTFQKSRQLIFPILNKQLIILSFRAIVLRSGFDQVCLLVDIAFCGKIG
jgi:hypothetical protein